jgi:hypothetical protein
VEKISVKLKRGCARKGGEDDEWGGKLASDGGVEEDMERVGRGLVVC